MKPPSRSLKFINFVPPHKVSGKYVIINSRKDHFAYILSKRMWSVCAKKDKDMIALTLDEIEARAKKQTLSLKKI